MSARTLLMAAATAGPPGASLNLSFMSGTLDPRITFTRASTATYFDAIGTMQTVSGNAPRFDYDPVTHALRGLLIEEARTNLVFPSVPATGIWAGAGPVQSLGGSTVAPDGTTSIASRIMASDTTSAARSYNPAAVTVAASGTYTITAFLKRDGHNAYIQVNATGGATAVSVAYYDLVGGTAVVGADLIAGLTNRAASITPIANGWYRVTFSFAVTATNTAATAFFGPCTTVSSTGDNRAYTGVVGQGLYIWGAQIEAGAFPTSYVPTVGATATRASDFCVITNASWFASPGGSWMAEFVNIDPVYAGKAGRIVAQNNTNGKAPLYLPGTLLMSQYDGGVVATANTASPNVVTKAASTWTSGTGKVCLNGAAVATGALSGGYSELGAGVGLLSSGTGSTVAEQVSGYIRRVRYWPRLLSDAEMQAVTR